MDLFDVTKSLHHEEFNPQYFDSNSNFEVESQTYKLSSSNAIETSTFKTGEKRKKFHIYTSHQDFSHKKVLFIEKMYYPKFDKKV